MPKHRAHGLWSSPIGPDVILGGARFGDVGWDEDSGQLVWSESSGGRSVLYSARPGGDAPKQLTTGLNVRGRIGYGGGEFTVSGGHVYFAADEGRLYRQSLTADDARPITPAFGAAAAPAVHPEGRYVAYIHRDDEIDRLAIVDSEGDKWPVVLAQGADFYIHPSWSPDGTLLAYVTWDFPHMPWDRSTLHVARFDENAPGGPALHEVRTIAGGDEMRHVSGAVNAPRPGSDDDTDGVSVMQPMFSPDGRLLVYISDVSGFWQLHAYDLKREQHVQLTDAPFEHGVPAWVQGQRTYDFAPDGRSVYYLRNEAGFHRLMRCTLYDNDGNVRPESSEIPGAADEYKVMTQIAVVPSNRPSRPEPSDEPGAVRIAFLGASPDIPTRIVVVETRDAADRGGATSTDADDTGTEFTDAASRIHVMRRSRPENFIPGILSTPEPVTWEAPDGTTVHGLYYPPSHPHFVAKDELPPAIVNIHSGPTRQTLPEFEAKAQFFTSRGYAYVEPNYRGSTGYGRAYRSMLRGNWGVVDVEDAFGAGEWLIGNEKTDAERLVIMGGSAGAYTAFRALAERPSFFKAAITMYGVADLFGLAQDTHKFERHYTDQLVGALPDAAAVYRERSPVFHADKIRDPVAVFQGTDDAVVPKSQSDAIVAALQRNGVPCEYHVYDGEGHGWRQADTVAAVYNAVEAFLRRYVIFA